MTQTELAKRLDGVEVTEEALLKWLDSQYISEEAAANYFGITTRTLRDRHKKPRFKLKRIKEGHFVRYRMSSIIEYLNGIEKTK